MYELRCDNSQHFVLQVKTSPKFTEFIIRKNMKLDVKRLPTSGFNKLYSFRYEGYSLEDYAFRMLNNPPAGVVVTPRAKAHLTTLLRSSTMGKIAAPVKTAPVAPISNTQKVAPVAKPAKVKVEKPATDGDVEKAPRNRRDKIEGDKKIKVIGSNTARAGSVRHGILETIFASKTVSEATQSTVQRKDGTDYTIGMPDIYFCLENKLIEIY